MALLLGLLTATTVGCGDDEGAATAPPIDGVSAPSSRAVAITTTGCGDASATDGSGVVIGAGVVVTAAHVVVAASTILVTDGEGADHPASISALDTTRDLAVLSVPTVDLAPVELARAEVGDDVVVHGASSSGPVAAVATRVASLDVDEVRGTTRTNRSGYELTGDLSSGDSGAGVFDAHGGLVAVVFATATDRTDVAWATAIQELPATIDQASAAPYRCDPARSRVVPAPSPGSTR